MEVQTIGFFNISKVQMDPKDIEKIYKYIADAYKSNVLKPNMSYDEVMRIQNELINQLTQDTYGPNPYINTNVIEISHKERRKPNIPSGQLKQLIIVKIQIIIYIQHM